MEAAFTPETLTKNYQIAKSENTEHNKHRH